MDPLSMTSAIIAVLQLTTTLTGYLNEVRNATAEQAKLAIEASNLHNLLTNLRFRVEAVPSDDPWFSQVKMLGIQNGPLDQLKDTLDTMVKKISSSRKRDQIKSALTWKFTKLDVENALARMERLKSLITYAVTNDLFTLSQAMHGEVVALGERTEQLRIRTERLQTYADQELQSKLSRWLGLPDPSTNYHAALEKRHPETGTWLLNSQSFNAWKTSMFSLMWLHGNPGCGKTVLSAATLQNVIQDKSPSSGSVVAYFYFDFKDVEKQSSKKAIRSLLFQFAIQMRDHLQALEKVYEQCQNGQQQPAEKVMRSLLVDMVAGTEHKYVILDALDECADREAFLPFLQEFTGSKPQNLRVMATSRREKDIEGVLSNIANHNVNIQSAVVDQDIRIYIRDQLATDTELKKWPPKVQAEIIEVMMKKAGGMFQWVYCQLQSIRKCVRLKALKQALSSLPKTLDDTYYRILRCLESDSQLHDAVHVLQWLCFSGCPLRLSEMIEVLAIENGDDGGFFPDERLPDPDDIKVICSSLINSNLVGDDSEDWSVDNWSPGASDDDSIEAGPTIRIQLAHFSVKEYLLSDRCALQADFQAQTCHEVIAENCLRYLLYLSEKVSLTHEFVDQHPLALYAARYWWQHAQKIDNMYGSAVLDLALKLLTGGNDVLLSWVQLYDADEKQSMNLSRTRDHLPQPLYYAVLMELSEVVGSILEAPIDVNADGGIWGTALQAASGTGNEKVVQMLLDAGADINAGEGRWGTALQAASGTGNEKVVQILIDAGVDINADGRWQGTALQVASGMGNEKVVQMLLDAGADINADGGWRGTALQVALDTGSEKVVQMLLDAGADVNANGGGQGTALQVASGMGDERVVQMLLDAGADVNANGRWRGTALQVASGMGDERVVQMLLDAGADVNANGRWRGTALQAVSGMGDEKVVQMLLDAGADVNADGRWQGTALQVASDTGNEKVVQMLLDAGADINADGGQWGTALQVASRKGNEKVVQMLLAAGANINIQEGDHDNALRAASDEGHEGIAQILPEAGAEVNALGEGDGSAL